MAATESPLNIKSLVLLALGEPGTTPSIVERAGVWGIQITCPTRVLLAMDTDGLVTSSAGVREPHQVGRPARVWSLTRRGKVDRARLVAQLGEILGTVPQVRAVTIQPVTTGTAVAVPSKSWF